LIPADASGADRSFVAALPPAMALRRLRDNRTGDRLAA